MKETYLQDQTFEPGQRLERGEYENCLFRGCDLSEQDFSQYSFIDCTFDACNLSLAKLHKTLLNNVQFEDCKMLGLRFDHCNPIGLSFSFTGCQLQHASFYKVKSRKTRFSKGGTHRLLRILYFGLVDINSEGEFLRKGLSVIKTDLFDKLIKIEWPKRG